MKLFNISNCFNVRIDEETYTISYENVTKNIDLWVAKTKQTEFMTEQGAFTITVCAQNCPEYIIEGSGRHAIYTPGTKREQNSTKIRWDLPATETEVIRALKNWAEYIGQTMTLIEETTTPMADLISMRRFLQDEEEWNTWNQKAQRLLRRVMNYREVENIDKLIIRVKSQFTRGWCFWWPKKNLIWVNREGRINGPDSRSVWTPIESANTEHISSYKRILMGMHSIPSCCNCAGTVKVLEDPEQEIFITHDKVICAKCCEEARNNTELYPCDNPTCQDSRLPRYRSRTTVNVRIPGSRQFLHFCSEKCKRAAGFVSCDLRSCSIPRPKDHKDWLNIEDHHFCCEEHAVEAGWRVCGNCEEWHQQELVIGEENYCSSDCAISAGYKRCPSCDEWHIEEEVAYCDECDTHYCPSCESAHESRHIERVWQIRVREPKKNMEDMLPGEPTFGIELEVGSLPKGPVNEIVPSRWGIHQDGSTMSGYEFVTPPFQITEWNEIKKTLNKLEAECAITQKEGTHLHIGNWVDQFHAIRFYLNATHIQETLKQIIAPSRTQNSYCMFRPEMKLRLVANTTRYPRWWIIDEYERYRAINGCAYTEHETIEIRCHQGTVNEQKLAKWIELWRNLYMHTIEGAPMIYNCCTVHMLQNLGIGHEYWEARSQVLHPKTWRISAGNKMFNCGKEPKHNGDAKVQLKFFTSPVHIYLSRHDVVKFTKTEELEEFIVDLENTNTLKGWVE